VRCTNSSRPSSHKQVQNTCYCTTIPGNTPKLKDFVLSDALRLITVRIAASNGSVSIWWGVRRRRVVGPLALRYRAVHMFCPV